MMKYKQRLEDPKQTSMEDLQSHVWKQQELNLGLSVGSQESTKSEKAGRILTDSNRKGDLAEYYAVTWLWDNGYEVFMNSGSTGPIDMIAFNLETKEFILIDVKMARLANNQKNATDTPRQRTQEQKDLGVVFLIFDPYNRKLNFVKHRE